MVQQSDDLCGSNIQITYWLGAPSLGCQQIPVGRPVSRRGVGTQIPANGATLTPHRGRRDQRPDSLELFIDATKRLVNDALVVTTQQVRAYFVRSLAPQESSIRLRDPFDIIHFSPWGVTH